jgi:hypothetical protein
MEKILGVKPGDFGFESSDPLMSSSSQITNTIASGQLGVSNPNPLDDNDIFRKTLHSGKVFIPGPSAPTTQYYNPDDLKRYRPSAEYAPFMNPLADNEKVAADNWSKLDALKTGISGMLDNGIAAYGEYNTGFPRLLRAMYHFDTSYLGKTEAEFAAIGKEQEKTALDNPIYYPEGVGQHDIFTRQFLSSAFQNAGFTLGTMAGFAQDVFLFKKFGNLSKLFQGSAAARSATVAAEIGETTSVISTAAKEKALKESAERMITENTGRLGQKTLFEKFANAGKHIPIVGSVIEAGSLIQKANAARATMGVAAFTEAEIARIGVGGLARGYQEYNFAVSEAATEGGGTYADIYEDAISSYKEKNDNNDPDEATKQLFRQNALEGATKDFGRNAVVLAIMNKIAFGNFFRKFGADSKFLNLIANDAGKFYGITAGVGEKAIFKTYKRKFLGAFSDAGDIYKLFGSKAVAKQVGKDFARGLGKIQLLEGLQENIQDGINFSLRKHYKDIYDGKVSTWSDDFKAAVDDQVSEKGWATFLQGAMTGLFISPITGTMERVSTRLNESKEHREQLNKMLESLNVLGSKPSSVLEEPIRNIKSQLSFNSAMTDAAKSGLKYEYFNNSSSAIITQALYAKRTGTFDAFKTFLNAYGTEYDPKEFKEATGIDVEEFGKSSPAEFMSDLTGKLERYSELYDKYNNQFGQYFTIENVGTDPHAKQRYSFSVAALQDAIHNIAFNEAKAENSLTRAGEIARNISEKNKSIGNAATSTFNTITDYQLGEVQVSILNNEIKTLEEIEGVKTKETLNLIELKKKELEVLKKWNAAAYKIEEQTSINEENNQEETQEVSLPLDFTTLTAEEQDNLSGILAEYYTIKNKQNNIKTVVSKTEITNILQDINDYQRLNRDYKEYMYSVNLLADPKNSLKLMHSFEDARVGAFARLMHDKYTELAKMSGIFERYVNNNPNDMDELLKIARSPFTSIETSKKLYDHLERINKMINDFNDEQVEQSEVKKKEAEAAFLNLQKEAFNMLASAPVNIRLMTEEEAVEFLSDHYEAKQDDDGNFLGELQRVYKDADGNKQISHLIPDEQIENFFKDKEGFKLFDMSTDDLFFFIENFEQTLYDKEAGTTETPESTEEHQVIANEVKKLKNLVGKQVIYQGRKGTLQRNEKGFYIQLDSTEDIIEIGEDNSYGSTSFIWETNEQTGRLEMVDKSNDLILDDIVGLELIEDGLAEEEQTITGVNPNSQTINRHTVEYISESTLRIDGREYTIQEDEKGSFLGITYTDQDGNTVFLTIEEAKRNPDSKVAFLVNTARISRIQNGVNVTQETLDEANKVLESITPAETVRVKLRSKGQITKNIVNDMIDAMPDDVADIYDKYFNNKTRNQLSEEEIKKLSAWAQDTYEKLQKIEQSVYVVNAIDYISKHIINPINRKYGEQIITKPKRKATKSSKAKDKTADGSGKSTTKGPKQGTRGVSKTKKTGIVEAVDNAKDQIEKHRKEVAVKMEELLPAANLFTLGDINEAIDMAQLNPKDLKASKKQKTKQNPYEDDSLLKDFICKR